MCNCLIPICCVIAQRILISRDLIYLIKKENYIERQEHLKDLIKKGTEKLKGKHILLIVALVPLAAYLIFTGIALLSQIGIEISIYISSILAWFNIPYITTLPEISRTLSFFVAVLAVTGNRASFFVLYPFVQFVSVFLARYGLVDHFGRSIEALPETTIAIILTLFVSSTLLNVILTVAGKALFKKSNSETPN